MKRFISVLAALAATVGAADAQTIYPIDRAAILAGSRFDLKVEFPGVIASPDVKVTVNGVDHARALGRAATFVEREKGVDASAVLLRDVSINQPGDYKIVASDGKNSATVTWQVYDTKARQAKNVILFVGDGMGIAVRTAARMLSKGIKEGKYRDKLAMDDMPNMALVGTSGVDSVVTDSANAMSAYATGHKASVNALGVYADRTPDSLDDPRVETITSLVKRKLNMAVGIVTNTEIEDATPAGMVAHTRRRSDYNPIVEQFFDAKPDVIMGGGSLNFLPKSVAGSRRTDDVDYLAKFKDAGYVLATTDAEMKAAAGRADTRRLLGLFHSGNLDGVWDRKFLKKGTVDKFPDQPDLTDQVRTALEVLSRKKEGFVLMVESGLIDKFEHPLDWERAVMDTIMLDNAVKVAKDWAGKRNDTLIMVVADHSHGYSIVGTVNDDVKADEMRDKVGTYDKSVYPNYPAPNAEGYPEKLDVSRRLALFANNFPDHYETFRPHLEGPNVPAVREGRGPYVANEAYKDVPGAMLRIGNLPRDANTEVHTADDVVLTATGPGAANVHGFMENTDVFKVMAQALGLGRAKTPAGATASAAR